jgi:hypothetical protein
VACYEEKTHVITYLLKNGSIVNKHGIRGDTPLHIAVSNCSKKSVLELIEIGANVDALNYQNETPLHIVTRQNRIEMLRILLNHAKNLNICSLVHNRTPFKSIMDDIQIDKLNMAILLVRAGCNVNLSYNQTYSNCVEAINDSQSFVALNTNESPFRHLFKIPKYNFKYANNVRNDSLMEIGILSFDENSSLRSLVNLIEIIFRAGYLVNCNDSLIYKESWLFSYLNQFEINSMEFKAKQILDHYFLFNVNNPSSLQNLCKFKTRSLLNKPLDKSIQGLDIPVNLKTFLNLDTVDV